MTHRLEERVAELYTHKLIKWLDAQPISEPEKLAVLLAAGYAQEAFMRESKDISFAYDIERVKVFHEETIVALSREKR